MVEFYVNGLKVIVESSVMLLFGVSAYISVYLFLNSKIATPRRCNMRMLLATAEQLQTC